MQKELLEKLKSLLKEVDNVDKNAACWKAARKLQSAIVILETEWPKETPPKK